MQPNTPNLQILTDEVAQNAGVPPKVSYSLETLTYLICKQRVNDLENKMRSEFKDLKTRQSQVKFLHQLLKGINLSTDNKGNFDCTGNEDLLKMFGEAKEMGIEVDQGKLKYNREERERLVDNIRMTCDDLNIQNEMQLQTITRLTNERYESFQLAKSIMKPLHDDKVNKARAISGRG